MTNDEITRLANMPKLNNNHLAKSPLKQLFDDISSEIGSNNPRQILHHAVAGSNVVPLCECGINERKWHIDRREYRPYCGPSCAATFSIDKIKATNMEKYGVEWATQLQETKDKSKATAIEKYGVEYYTQTEEYLSSRKATNMERYGVEHPSQNLEIAAKTKQTNMDRYGVDCTLHAPHIAAAVTDTFMERYGGHFSRSPLVKQKTIDTNIERYGVPYSSMVPNIQRTRAETNMRNYYSQEVYYKINDPTWLTNQNLTKPINLIAQELGGISPCVLGTKFKNAGITPNRFKISSQEIKLSEYFKSRGVHVELSNRKILAPKEIDLYFPHSKVGVEINGLYWHSSEFIDKNAHLHKSQLATANGITLLHFTDWEVNHQWDIVVSKISNAIGVTSNKLYARKLKISPVNRVDKKEFLNLTHIQGTCNSSINIGLYNENELVMLATFGRSRYSSLAKWELLRLSSKLNTNIVGGASRLLRHFSKIYMGSGDKLISYCQTRLSRGDVYLQSGFVLSHCTPPNYFYVRAGKPEGSREQWQKHLLADKLPLFDSVQTEEENMRTNGYYRYYDCGQRVYLLEI